MQSYAMKAGNNNNSYIHNFAKAYLMALFSNNIMSKGKKKAQELAKEVFPWLIEMSSTQSHADTEEAPSTTKNAFSAENVLKYVYYLLGIYYTTHLSAKTHEEEIGIIYFQQAIELGYHPAYCNLGVCYIKGNGVPKDFTKGFECFLKSADEYQYPPGQHNTAICYEKGVGTTKDISRAVIYERFSAEQGFVPAIYSLASYYEHGKSNSGISMNLEEAVQLYHLAAEMGHENSAFLLASLYERGKGMKKDLDQAFEWYLRCARDPSEISSEELKRNSKGERGGCDIAMNHPLAQYKLCHLYEHGTGVEKDEKQAVYWCLRSAKNGNYLAQNLLGSYYEKGFIGLSDEMNEDTTKASRKRIKEAMKWYLEAAKQGFPSAQFNFARCLLKQYSLQKEKERSTEIDEDEEQQEIGDENEEEENKEIVASPKETLHWFRLCANQGDYSAQKSVLHCLKHRIGLENTNTTVYEAEIKRWKRLIIQQKEKMKITGKPIPLRDCYLSEDQYREDFPELIRSASNDFLMLPTSNTGILYTTLIGKVVKRRCLLDQKPYAVLHMPMVLYFRQQKRRKGSHHHHKTSALDHFYLLQQEIDQLIQLSSQHQHIQQYHQYFFNKPSNQNTSLNPSKYLLIATEYIEDSPNNTLLARITAGQGAFTSESVVLWLLQCIDALRFLHEKGIYHYNLSPENIFLMNDHYIKLGNFIFPSLLFPTTLENNNTTNTSNMRANCPLKDMLTSSVGKRIFHSQIEHHYVTSEKIETKRNLASPSASLKRIEGDSADSGSSENYDYGKDEIWILGCIFIEVLLGQRLSEVIHSPFYHFTSDELHHHTKEHLLALCQNRINDESQSNIGLDLVLQFIQLALLETQQRPSSMTLYEEILHPSEVIRALNIDPNLYANNTHLPGAISAEISPSYDNHHNPSNQAMVEVPIGVVIDNKAIVIPEGYTAERISEIYEMIRLNKIKIKKLEKLSFKYHSLLAKGFLMTLYACDIIYYSRKKAKSIAKDIFPWLLEEEKRSTPQPYYLIEENNDNMYDEVNYIDTMNDYAEYINFFLGIFYSQRLYDLPPNTIQSKPTTPHTPLPAPLPPQQQQVPRNDEEDDDDASYLPPAPKIVRESGFLLPRNKEKKSRHKDKHKHNRHHSNASNASTSTTMTMSVQEQLAAAIPYFLQSIENGYLTSQNNLGVCYALGLGVDQDYNEAVTWFRMSASDGNELGQFNLALCYEKSYGVTRMDKIEAVRLFRLSAEQGCAMARCKLGECYELGIGVPISYSEAFQWYRLSADQGLAKGQYHVGQCYERGRSVDIDLEIAFRWYKQSAELGYGPAIFVVASCYESGRGIEQNEEEARKWYEKSLEQDNEESKFITINSFLM